MEGRVKHIREAAFDASDEEILSSPRKPSLNDNAHAVHPQRRSDGTSFASQQYMSQEAFHSSDSGTHRSVNDMKYDENVASGSGDFGGTSSQSKDVRDNIDNKSPVSSSHMNSLRAARTASTPDLTVGGRLSQGSKQHTSTTDTQQIRSTERPNGDNASIQPVPRRPNVSKERSSSNGTSWKSSQSGHASTQLSNSGFSLSRESSGTYRSTKSSTDDGFRSIRMKAKGMFNRMFTPSKNAPPVPQIPTQHTHSSKPLVALASTGAHDQQPSALSMSPSVLPVRQSSFAQDEQSLPQVAREVHNVLDASGGAAQSSAKVPSDPPTRALVSNPPAQPSGLSDDFPEREPSPVSAAAVTMTKGKENQTGKQNEEPAQGRTDSKRISRHVREGALSQIDGVRDHSVGDHASAAQKQDFTLFDSVATLGSSPERFRQWRETMEGIIDGDGVEDALPRELGISAASLSLAPVYSVKKSISEPQGLPTSLRRHPSTDTKHVYGIEESAKADTVNPSIMVKPISSGSSIDPSPVDHQPQRLPAHSRPATTTVNESLKDSEDAFPMLLKRGSLAAAQPQFNTRSISWGAMASATNPMSADNSAFSSSQASDELELQGKALAEEMFAGIEDHVPKDKVAQYISGLKPLSKYALKHYLGCFDFANLRLDDAFRVLCGKLYLKAESQEIDRILEAFSERFFECNPNTIFGTPGTIHTVTGSFLLLNTDLHIAELSHHMSRAQFVKLTLETITGNRAACSPMSSTSELNITQTPLSMSARGPADGGDAISEDKAKLGANSGAEPLWDSGSTLPAPPVVSQPPLKTSAYEPRNRISSSQSMGSIMMNRGWETELESALRDIYLSIKHNQILLPVTAPVEQGGLERNASLNSNWENRRSSLRGVSSVFQRSIDGRASPAPSQALSSTRNMPTLGFVSNLSHTAIKEQEDEVASLHSAESIVSDDELTDDQLALMGAPWAKEGNLNRKLYWEAPGKRSKDKTWKEHFAVLQRGEMQMFVFGESAAPGPGSAVGGGNWLTNARATGDLNLSHALASALLPPGYNASRPHCFRLTLPTGEMDFFQAGTDELVQEWVSTCNYWAARRSRPPLPGGVTNAEYGWRSLESHTDDKGETVSLFSNKSAKSKLSFQNTIGRRNNSMINIADWKAPQPPLIPSHLDEEAQLESLQKHLERLTKELKQHKTYEEALNSLYPPRSTNLAKAIENWRNKSLYIHTEITKYGVYVDSLQYGIALRVEKQGEKKLYQSLRLGTNYESDEGHDDNEGVYDDDDDDDDDGLPYEEG